MNYIECIKKVYENNKDKNVIVDKDGKRFVTYNTLDIFSDKISDKLNKLGVKKGDKVIIYLDRGFEYVASLIGIWKRGAVAIPTIKDYPKERIDYIIEDSNVKTIIDENFINDLDKYNSYENLAKETDDAILYYTSGSTGKPKGVMHKMQDVMDALYRNPIYHEKGKNIIRTVSVCTFSFATFLTEILFPLYSNITIHIASDEVRKDSKKLSNYIDKNNINAFFINPHMLRLLDFKGNSVKAVLIGGERVSNLYSKKYNIYNCYGSTENYGGSMYYKIDKNYENTPIGRPYNDMKVFIVDENNNKVKNGEKGEICVEYKTTTFYYKDEERTERIFEKIDNGKVLFHTGDIGYINNDNLVMYVTRKDFMVKINGQRVEPFEIENNINEVDGILNSVVKSFEDENNQTYLVAYYEAKKDMGDLIREKLREKLAPYMIPRFIVKVDAIPKNINGKIDRNRLTPPDVSLLKEEYAEFSNEIEKVLCEQYEKILNINKVGANDNFFSLGGDSIKVLLLIKNIEKYNITTDMVFVGKTPRNIAKLYNGKRDLQIKHHKEDIREINLTFSQQGVYLDNVNDEKSLKYNVSLLLTLSKCINKEKFEYAVKQVIKNHKIFNSKIVNKNGDIKLVFFDKEIEIYDKKISILPFNLESGPLYRAALYDENGNTYFMFDCHHIIFDGVSTNVFVDEIRKVYDGEKIQDEELNIIDISIFEKDLKNKDKYKNSINYFEKEFFQVDTLSKIVSDSIEEYVKDNKAKVINYDLKNELSISTLMRFIKEKNVTENTFFTSVFAYALAKFNNSNDVIFTTASNGRHDGRLKDSIGMFVKTMPLHFNIDDNILIRDFLKNNNKYIFDTINNDIVSFSDLSNKFNLTNEVSFVYQSNLFDSIKTRDGVIKLDTIDIKEVISDISMMVFKTESSYCIKITYKNCLYSEELMNSFINMYIKILKGFINFEYLKNINFVDDKDIKKIENNNKTEVLYDEDSTIIELFKNSVKKYGDNLALVSGKNKYTYKELDKITDKIATYIRKVGGYKEKIVGILVDRNEFMLIGALSSLKSNSAYLPLDPTYPKERLNLMLKDAKAFLLIYESKYKNIIDDTFEGKIVDTKELLELKDIDTNLPMADKNDLFSLVYTSGTTGKPKGVMVEHRNVMCLVAWHTKYYMMNQDSNVAAYASFGFDANIYDMYPPITVGATLHIIEDDIRLDLNEVRKYFNENNITHAVMTTQVARQLACMDDITTLRHLTAGGEKLVSLNPPKFNFYDAYGPSECTVIASIQKLDKKYKDVPTGKAVDNVKLYIIDNIGRLLPYGATGELVVAGPHVVRGYLNNIEKTKEVFLDNIYFKKEKYERIYKTGDVLRFLSDGRLQYIGRQDSQVKVRGFRIELTEVEEVVRRYNDIKDATVVAFDDTNGGKYLVAYIESENKVDINLLKEFIKNEKPFYMVPSIIMQIPKIPYTQNQKVNRKALPVPEKKVEEIIKPSTDMEKEIFDVVKDILGTDDFGITNDIYDFGLTSIGALRLNVELSKKFDKPMKISDLKDNNTIEKLVKFFEEKDDKNNVSFVNIDLEKNEYPLTETQNGIFVESSQDNNGVTYNMPLLFKISKDIKQEKLIDSIYKTINNHNYLNSHIIMKENGDIRIIKREVKDNYIEIINTDKLPDANTLIRHFNILNEKLFRIEIYNVSNEAGYYLFIDFHHIIADGISLNIIIKNIFDYYHDEKVECELIDGFNIGIEEIKDRQSNHYIKAKEYYQKLVQNVEINTLPTQCPDRTEGVGDIKRKGKVDVSKIKEYCSRNNYSINSFMNAVFGYVLSRFSYKDDVVFTTIYNGRNDTRYNNTVSMLVKTLPIVYKTNKNIKVKDYIKSINSQLLNNMANDIYSFAEIKKDLGINADIIFVYQDDNFDLDSVEKGVSFVDIAFKVAKAPISFEINVKDNKFLYHLSFVKEMYSWDFIDSLITSYDVAIENFIDEEYLKDVSLLSEKVKIEQEKYNDRKTDYEKVPVVKLFEREASLYKDRPCYVFDDKTFTYDYINKSANKIANYILEKKINNNSIIGILLNRSEYIPIAQYGVLKSGCAFISMIPDYPDDRIDFCLRDATSPVVITTEKIKKEKNNLFSSDKPYTVYTIEGLLNFTDDNNPNIDIPLTNFAYCIYTSGTTGKPKGVLINHKNLTCFVQTCFIGRTTMKDNGEPFNILAMANITFDGSMLEHIMQSCRGNTIYLTKENDIHNPIALSNLIIKNKIEFMFATPSLMSSLIEIKEFHPAIRTLKVYFSGAEAFSKSLFEKIKSINNNILILDGYGPSECTVCCNERIVNNENDLNIGIAAENSKLFVFDKDKNQLPYYALGELIIGGDIVGDGYMNLPEKTNKVFIDYKGEKVYCCGDIVRQKNDGCYLFYGRVDNLVKLRGYRIEIDEIEKVLKSYNDIIQAIVIVKNNGNEDYLAAYFTASKEIDIKELTKYLKTKLTYYMVPGALMQLETMPLNVSGKIDKAKLPEIKKEKKVSKVSKKQLVNDISEVFKIVLNLDEYYPDDNFFEMGGTSLSASKVTMKLLTKNIEVDYGDIFEYKTPLDLARYLEEKNGIKSEEFTDNNDEDKIRSKFSKIADKNTLEVLKYNNLKYADEVRKEELGDILLTGANGFLGVHILKELLENEKGHIYCIIRKGTFSSNVERLKNVLYYYFDKAYKEEFEKRITTIDLDITEENIVENLKDINVNTIINVAACVKHYASDDIIEKINVKGVENLINVALQKNAKFIQISTTSVPGVYPNNSFDEKVSLHEDDLFVVDSMDNKYVLSKYKAETRVYDAIYDKKLKGKVVRVGNLMGRDSDGEFQINQETNAFLNALKGFATLKHSPISHMTDPMRFSPIDYTAKAVITLSKTNDMFTAFNAENRFGFDEMQLIDACNRCGIEITPIDDDKHYGDFNKKLADDKINKRLSALLTNDKPDIKAVLIDNDFTTNILYRLGFSWPLIEKDYLDKVIMSLKTMGFFDDDSLNIVKDEGDE